MATALGWGVVLGIACVVAHALLGCARRRPRPAPADFNQRVLALTQSYAPGASGGYCWPAPAGSDGMTRDLRLGDEVVARGGAGGTHCVGVTFEVFWRALEACPGGAAAALDAAAARRLRTTWYVPVLGGQGAAEALEQSGLGTRVSLDDARPGDFVQAWSRVGLGHSMVLLGFSRDSGGAPTSIRYWSSQPWTDGIGIGETAIAADDSGFDPAQIYIARAHCPAPAAPPAPATSPGAARRRRAPPSSSAARSPASPAAAPGS
ncbi:MAG: hypothetical protein IT370_13060 [Deltaproteobacteria bacterium]|nr:hypothetical protein [Deltaproteobacteria bacterium]